MTMSCRNDLPETERLTEQGKELFSPDFWKGVELRPSYIKIVPDGTIIVAFFNRTDPIEWARDIQSVYETSGGNTVSIVNAVINAWIKEYAFKGLERRLNSAFFDVKRSVKILAYDDGVAVYVSNHDVISRDESIMVHDLTKDGITLHRWILER